MLAEEKKHGTDITFVKQIRGLDESAERGSLTGGEAASKEHIEEVFGSDVGLKSPVEVKASSVRVARAARFLSSCQVILPFFVGVAKHCICVPDLWKDSRSA